jgi:VWFA-related protein
MQGFVSKLAVAAALGAALSSAPRAQEVSVNAEQTFKSSVDLVTIQASVRDKRGRPVAGLKPADFEVRDNGALRPIVSIHSDDRSPLSVAVVVDISGSMSVAPKLAMARRALDGLLSQLRIGSDEVGIFTFDSTLQQRAPFTAQFAGAAHVLDNVVPFGATSLYDATADAARELATRSATHKAVVVITDGIDTSSALNAAEVSGVAASIDVPVYVVAAVPMLDERAMLEAAGRAAPSDAADLRDLAEWTGGHLIFASTFVESTTVAARLVDELRQQYVLTIEAAGSREWRRLDIRVKHASLNVKARSGYFGG